MGTKQSKVDDQATCSPFTTRVALVRGKNQYITSSPKENHYSDGIPRPELQHCLTSPTLLVSSTGSNFSLETRLSVIAGQTTSSRHNDGEHTPDEEHHNLDSKTVSNVVTMIRKNIIGDRCLISTPFGTRELVYADYTASGRALRFIEQYMTTIVLSLYGNTHTEASSTGAQTTHLREEARDIIHRALNAPKDEYAVIFTGTGSTGAIDKLERIMGFSIPEYADKKWKLKERIPIVERPVIFISHFEHHSNELIWRESIAEVVVIKEDVNGQPDLGHLEKELIRYKNHQVPLIGSFSAGSNVTGIRSDTRAIARVLHKHGAYAFFDFAGVGAYVDIDAKGVGSSYMDAIFLSPHKFIGGPGTSGVLVARRKLFHGAFGVKRSAPSVPGGGTVSFVSQYRQAYVKDAESQEDAGTPGIPQCIKTGLVFKTKEMVGSDVIEKLESCHMMTALKAWRTHPRIALMGSDRKASLDPARRVPIFSFNILSPVGLKIPKKSTATPRKSVPLGCAKITPTQFKSIYAKKLALPLHQNFVIAMLNDVYGIQARGGCSCAGPYGHLLFGVGGEDGKPVSERLHDLAVLGYEAFKPGWARLNLNYFASDGEVDFMVEAVKQIASHGWKLLPLYTQDLETGRYIHRSWLDKAKESPFSMSDITLVTQNSSMEFDYPVPVCLQGERGQKDYQSVLAAALELYKGAEHDMLFGECQDFTSSLPKCSEAEDVWWLTASEAAKKLRRLRRINSKRVIRKSHRHLPATTPSAP